MLLYEVRSTLGSFVKETGDLDIFCVLLAIRCVDNLKRVVRLLSHGAYRCVPFLALYLVH